MKYLPVVFSILFTLVGWGVQSNFLLLSQKEIGPWRTLFLYAGGFAATGFIIGYVGCLILGDQISFSRSGAGLMAGVTACLGSVGIILAFMYAGRLGNDVGTAWISPSVGGLLPIFYLLGAVVLLPKPKDGWGQLLAPGYLIGIFSVVMGVVLLNIYRPK